MMCAWHNLESQSAYTHSTVAPTGTVTSRRTKTEGSVLGVQSKNGPKWITTSAGLVTVLLKIAGGPWSPATDAVTVLVPGDVNRTKTRAAPSASVSENP